MTLKRDVVVQNAEKLVARGKIEAAIKEYLRLIEENPNDTNILNRIGDLYVRINRILEATKYFYDIAKFWADDGFYLKAIAILKKINKLDPSILEVYDRLGELYAKQGMNSEAASHYQYLADYLSRQGKSGEALDIYRKITAMDPDNIALRGRLAELLNASGDMKNAVAEYQAIGKMLVTNGHIQEAIQVYNRALKMDPRNVGMIKDLAASLLAEGRHADVVRLLESASAIQLNDPQVFQILAQAHLGAGQASMAMDAITMGLRKSPRNDQLLELKGDILATTGRSEDAITAYLGAVDLAMSDNNPTRALSLCTKVLRKDPVSIAPLSKMVEIYTQLHQEGYVIQTLSQLAEAYLQLQKYSEAVDALEHIIRLEPENVQHRDKLAFVKRKMGQPAPPQQAARPREAAGEPPEPPVFDDAATHPPVKAPVFSRTSEEDILLEEDLPTALRDYMGEHMVEIEVFSKYDLTEKAVQGLKSVLERVPHYVPALEKLLQIYLEDNRLEDALQLGNHLLSLYARRGLGDRAENLREQMLHQGIAPEELSVGPAAPAATPAMDSRMRSRPTASTPRTPARPMAAPTSAPEQDSVLELDLTAEETDLDLEFAALSGTEEAADFRPSELAESDQAFDLEIEEPSLMDAEPEFLQGVQKSAVPEARVNAFADTNPALILPEAIPFPAAASPPTAPLPDAPARPASGTSRPTTPAPAPAAPPPVSAPRREIPPTAPPPAAKPRPASVLPEFETLMAGKRTATTPPPPPAPAGRVKSGAPVKQSLRDLDRLAETMLEKPKKKAAAPPPQKARSAGPLSDFLGVNEEMDSLLQKSIPLSPEPPVEVLGELDFYLDQEIADEAQKVLADLQDRFHGHPEVESRAARFEALSRKTAAPAAPAPPGSAVKDGDSLFSEEEEFFDLASELEEDLSDGKKEMVLPSTAEPTLEEVFEQFKQGVRQTLSPEDYDTHYNLGIAYKEMGLVDEAISEFQIACKDPERLIDCCSMLGLCFMEKGMPQLAEKWYRKAMESPELSEDEQLGILYDLGSLFMQSGDLENAYKSFLEIYGLRNDYRDVVERLKELERAKKTAN